MKMAESVNMDEERDDQRTSGHVVPSGAPHTGDPKNDPRLSSAAAYNENFHAVSKPFSETVEPVEQEKTDFCDLELLPASEIDVDGLYEQSVNMGNETDDQWQLGHVVSSGAPYTGDPKNDPKLSSAAAYNENVHAVFKQLSKTVGKEKTCLCDTKLPPDSGINLSRSIESLESNSPLYYIGKSVTEEKAVCFTDSDSMVDQPVKNQQEVCGSTAFSASLPSPDILEFDHTTGSGKCVCQLVVEESGPVNERYECPAAVQCRTEGLSNTKKKTEEPLKDEGFKDLGSQSSTQNQTKSAKNLEMSAKSSKRHNRSVKRKRVSERQHMSPNGSFLNQKKGKWKIIEKGTSRGGDVLYAPDGREYIRKRTSKKGIDIWRCRVRNKKSKNKECPAIVKQCGKKFVVAGKDHTH